MAAGAVLFAELRSPEVRTSQRPLVALLPVGAVEPHGPHAPLGTDTLISEAVCRRAAALLEEAGVRPLVLPPVPYGVTDFSRDFPGSLSIRESTLRALVADICDAAHREGVEHRIIVNSHFEPAHVAALREVAARTGAVLLDITRRRYAERLTDEFRSGAAHGGRYETSIVLAVRPDLVDTGIAARLPELFVDMPAEMRRGKSSFTAMGMQDAYCGDPARATAEEGERTLTALAAMVAELVRERIA